MFPKVNKFPCTDLNQLYPPVRDRALKLIEECKKIGILIKITQTYRSTEYQAQLHKKMPNGASPPGLSMHEYHCAFDVCINSKTDAYNEHLLSHVGAIGEKLGLTWGGHFKRVDMPHFQYTGKLKEADIRKGKIPA